MKIFRAAFAAALIVCASYAPINGYDGDKLQRILSTYENDKYDDLHSIIVIQNNTLVGEHYYNGGDRHTLVDVRSAGKSVTSLLFGIALEQGAIENINDPVSKYWPESKSTAVGSARLADVLTMRSGLDADGNNPDSAGYEDNMDESGNPLAVALAVPHAEKPGTRYRYNSHAAYITGIVIDRATGNGLENFARDSLFAPLKMENWNWQEDQSGQTKGQGNLFLTAPDFARIGQMVLNGGTYNGRKIVSQAWIEDSLKPRVDVREFESNADGYGYYWFHQTYMINDRLIKVSFASGNGGNKIYIIPQLDMVVSVMSRAYGQGRGQRRSENILKAILALHSPG